MPHKFSEYDPALAAGDINGDGLDDIVIGDSHDGSAKFLLQQSNGRFIQKTLPANAQNNQSKAMGIALFDADGDGDLDLYIASGGYKFKPASPEYADRLFINDGKANFKLATEALPQNFESKSCVRVADYDNDGDLDLFVAGRVEPWNYPSPVSSFIYRNDSKGSAVKFTDVTSSVAPSLTKIGLTCDAIWTDYDNDGWEDLILAGEWMPIKILKNRKGVFSEVSTSGLQNKTGWWNSITAGDFDNDGDMDYVVGNLGENSYYKASEAQPVSIYAADYYKTGVSECIMTQYLKDTTGKLEEFPTNLRDDIIDQLPFIKKQFLTYKAFAKAPFSKLLTPEEAKSFTKYSANYFKSSFVRNNGNGTFTMVPLPGIAQFSALNGMITDDFDGDGNLDVCLNTNDFSTDPSNGRYDALNGLVLKGDGKGNFAPLSLSQSGICIPGNGRALVKLRGNKGAILLAASQNKGVLKMFQMKAQSKAIQLQPFDVSAIITYKDRRRQQRDVGYGNSFLSQSARFLNIDSNVAYVDIKNSKGDMRRVSSEKM